MSDELRVCLRCFLDEWLLDGHHECKMIERTDDELDKINAIVVYRDGRVVSWLREADVTHVSWGVVSDE
jgi:hypothetical protein